MKRKALSRIQVACFAAGLLSVPGGQAVANATATGIIGGITFQLTDLDPLDGVAPSITFLNGPRWVIYSNAVDTQTATSHDASFEGLFGSNPELVFASLASASAQSQSSGDPILGTGKLSSQATAEPAGYALAWSRIQTEFLLSPQTELVVSAHVMMTGSTEIQLESSGASYFLDLSGDTGSGRSFSSSSDRGYASPEPLEDPVQPHSFSFDRWVSVSLRNDGSVSNPGVLDGSLGVGTFSNLVQVVPEPQTWATLGLGLVGLAWRRRLASGGG
jgi:hypothetical protein